MPGEYVHVELLERALRTFLTAALSESVRLLSWTLRWRQHTIEDPLREQSLTVATNPGPS